MDDASVKNAVVRTDSGDLEMHIRQGIRRNRSSDSTNSSKLQYRINNDNNDNNNNNDDDDDDDDDDDENGQKPLLSCMDVSTKPKYSYSQYLSEVATTYSNQFCCKGLSWLIVSAVFLGSLTAVVRRITTNALTMSRRRWGDPIIRPETIKRPTGLVLSNFDVQSTSFQLPPSLFNDESTTKENYGGLDLWNNVEPGHKRQLQKHDDRIFDWYREDLFHEYFQDQSEEMMWMYRDAYQHPVKACNWPERVYIPRPNCNNIHETSMVYGLTSSFEIPKKEIKFLGSGYYRDVWLINDRFVLKQTRFDRDQNRDRLQKIQTEALIFEMLSASPLITDIYGYCAFSVAVEVGAYDMRKSILPQTIFQERGGYIDQNKLDELSMNDAFSLNNFTAVEKLDILLQMTESLAETHGLPTGPVVSGDIALDQWLRSRDEERIMLNDFDNAVFLSFNQSSREYCRYQSGSVGGFKTPEEHRNDFLDESVDIWKVGSLIFAVLTGLKPYYSTMNEDEKWSLIDAGTQPYLDPRYSTRSFIEGRLVEIMHRCHQFNAQERVSIFEVVALLKETKQMNEHEKQKELRQ